MYYRKFDVYGPSFGAGDVVGCGLDYRSRTIFYTLNGVHLGQLSVTTTTHSPTLQQ